MEESILILGAGIMQRPAIQSAKNLGLKVFVVDANPSAPCVGEADFFEPIDLKDSEAIARYALSLKENAGSFDKHSRRFGCKRKATFVRRK